jgi:hypothetical protein
MSAIYHLTPDQSLAWASGAADRVVEGITEELLSRDLVPWDVTVLDDAGTVVCTLTLGEPL